MKKALYTLAFILPISIAFSFPSAALSNDKSDIAASGGASDEELLFHHDSENCCPVKGPCKVKAKAADHCKKHKKAHKAKKKAHASCTLKAPCSEEPKVLQQASKPVDIH